MLHSSAVSSERLRLEDMTFFTQEFPHVLQRGGGDRPGTIIGVPFCCHIII